MAMPSDVESGDTLAAPGSGAGSAPGSADPTLPAPGTSADGSGDATMPATGGSTSAEVGLTVVDPDMYAERVEITRGGMGRIIAARDRRLGRRVAIKELRDPGEGLRARFEREALLTARLQHPAIVSVHEAGRWPSGEPFIAMKLVPGVALDKVIARAKTFDERLALLPHLLAVADALAYAHKQRVVHRDLKPANVLVGDFGETVVIDWGLAKDLADLGGEAGESAPYRSSADAAETAVGSVLGTPAYMPPEQARGQSVDERADVYAIGAMLYHVLGGVAPFDGKTAADVLAAVTAGPPTPLAERQPGLPRDLDAIVARAMARAPADRYPTARELAEDLRRFQTGQLVGAHRYSRRQLLWRWVKRHRGAVAVAVIALATLATVATVSLRRIFAEQRRTEEQRVLAEESRADAEKLVEFMMGDLRDKLEGIDRTDMLEGVTDKVRDYYASRPEAANLEERHRRAQALFAIAKVMEDRGNLRGALSVLGDAQAELEVEAAAGPGDGEAERFLAMVHANKGDILWQQKDQDAALAEMQAALVLNEQLVAREPKIANWKRDLASTHSRLGKVLAARGDLKGAIAHHRQALAVMERLAGRHPEQTSWQRDVIIEHNRLGDRLMDLGDLDAAVAEYRAGKTVVDRLLASEPDNAQFQSDLSISHESLADVLDTRGDRPGALAELNRALAIRRRLVELDAKSAFRKRALTVVLDRIGNILHNTGDNAGALVQYRESLAVREELVRLDPSNGDYQHGLAMSHDKIGIALMYSLDLPGAQAEYKKGLDILEQMVAQDPSDLRQQGTLSGFHDHLGDVLLLQEKYPEAEVRYRASLAIREKLAKQDPSDAWKQRDLTISLVKVADARAGQKDWTGAMAMYEKARAIREGLVAKDPSNNDWKVDLEKLRKKLATAAAHIKEGAAPGPPKAPP
jgi:tetratricopeptide (TPR) repeat protein